MSRKFYLGKGGQSFGPYSEKEFEAIRASDKIKEYTSYWDSESPTWQALDSPPPPPPPADETFKQKAAPAEREKKARHSFSVSTSPIEATCHDHNKMVSGMLRSITDIGCELISKTPTPERCFSNQGPVLLNLFDSKSGKSMTINAQLIGTARKEGRWAYQLKWEECPELVREAA